MAVTNEGRPYVLITPGTRLGAGGDPDRRPGRTAWQRERTSGPLLHQLPRAPLVPRVVRWFERRLRRL